MKIHKTIYIILSIMMFIVVITNIIYLNETNNHFGVIGWGWLLVSEILLTSYQWKALTNDKVEISREDYTMLLEHKIDMIFQAAIDEGRIHTLSDEDQSTVDLIREQIKNLK